MTIYLGEQLLAGLSSQIEPSRNIGQIIQSTIPLTDAGLHLLDGSLISGSGSYSAFVDYIANLYSGDEETFVQPTLTSNGTMGGNSFAVSSSSNADGREAYKSFDGNTATKWSVRDTRSGWLIFYNYKALKVSSIVYTPSTDYPSEDGGNLEILGSNDNINWTSLWTGSYIANSTQTFNVNSTDYYCYYKISITNGASQWAGLGNLTINASYIATPNYFCTETQWQSSVTTYGVCGNFVYDSTNNTVRLPKITGFVEGASSVSSLGDLTEAGLPDHTHTYIDVYAAFSQGRGGEYPLVSASNTSDTKTTSGASNSIYGNSSTVQPQSVKVLYYIVLATVTKTEIQVDIDEIATDLNGKADTDLNNVPASKGILTESYVNGTSWYRVYSDGWCEQGGGVPESGADINVSVTFLKAYKDTNYYINLTSNTTINAFNGAQPNWVNSRTKTGFSAHIDAYGAGTHDWQASGYIR